MWNDYTNSSFNVAIKKVHYNKYRAPVFFVRLDNKGTNVSVLILGGNNLWIHYCQLIRLYFNCYVIVMKFAMYTIGSETQMWLETTDMQLQM